MYHGSQQVIKLPEFGKGNPNNDYGLGFYMSQNSNLAGEWAVIHTNKDGYINEYELDYRSLSVLKLDALPIESWISVLMSNRKGTFNEINLERMHKFIAKFGIDLSSYDVVEGWRADDAFFSFIEDFLSVGLSLERMREAMTFGDLGLQVCLKSEKSFKNINYIKSCKAEASQYYGTAISRDRKARKKYWDMKQKTKGTLIIDIIGRD